MSILLMVGGCFGGGRGGRDKHPYHGVVRCPREGPVVRGWSLSFRFQRGICLRQSSLEMLCGVVVRW